MNDNELFQRIFEVIEAGLSVYGFRGVEAFQSYQPDQSQTGNNPLIFAYKYHTERVGWVSEQYTPTADQNIADVVYSQNVIDTIQFNVIKRVNTGVYSDLTAQDILVNVATILGSVASVDTLTTNGIAILNPGNITNVPWVDEKDLYEQNPSIDIKFNYNRTLANTLGAVTTYALEIQRV